MSRDEIEAVRKRSRAANAGPWVTDWNEMAKKTVFRRLSKWIPLSSEYRDALDADIEERSDTHASFIDISPEPTPTITMPITEQATAGAPLPPGLAQEVVKSLPRRGRPPKVQPAPQPVPQEPVADDVPMEQPVPDNRSTLVKRLKLDGLTVENLMEWAVQLGFVPEGSTSVEAIAEKQLESILKPGTWPSIAAQIKLACAK
jgi:hypothetical protein